MKILITGCDGQVGSCLVKQLQSCTNVELLAVDRKELDITDQLAVTEMVLEFRPDVIINSAAYTAVDQAEVEIELSYSINRDGPKYLAEAGNKSVQQYCIYLRIIYFQEINVAYIAKMIYLGLKVYMD